MDNDITLSIVKFSIALIIGISLISAVVNGTSTKDSIAISFTQTPHDGDTVVLDGHTFEFDNDGSVSDGNIAVTIGTTLTQTNDNFKTAVSTYYGVT